MAEADGRGSIQHVLAEDAVAGTPRSTKASSPVPSTVPAEIRVSPPPEGDEDNGKDQDQRQYSALTQTTRRNANGSVSSVFSGNKIRHLKKEDGVPLWRKDIQYEFLQAVFEDDKPVFTRLSDKSEGHSFAEVYIDTLAQSSKTSKILKEKLVQDQSSAITMAMVCLLVNVGRMNTTLNFFPEMRAQLRTYHSIPALQAQRDPHAYKQLQDAPRLKSILKGASEDEPQPGTIEEIKAAARPRTNAVNLIFVLAQYAPKVSEVHFNPPRDFFDLVMRPTLSSKSRARAFLWLMWWYLESDFSLEDSQKNPFGPGLEGEGAGGLPLKVPNLEVLTEEQAALENVDTEEEKMYGEAKRKERIAIVNSEPSPAMTALKRARKERNIFRPGYVPSELDDAQTPSRDNESPMPHGSVQHYYGSDGGSPSPPASILSGNYAKANNAPLGPLLGGASTPSRSTPSGKPKGPGRGNWRRNKFAPTTTHVEQSARVPPMPQSSPPRNTILPANVASEIMSRAGQLGSEQAGTPTEKGSKKSRPLTTHQLAINEYRQSRIRRILERGVQRGQVEARKKRVLEGGILRAWKRIRSFPPKEGLLVRDSFVWDSDEEEARTATESKEEEGKSVEETEWRLFGKRFRPGILRDPKGVHMAGYVLPRLREVEDAGEQAGHVARTMTATLKKAQLTDEDVYTFKERVFVRRKSEVEFYAEELEKDTWDLGDRPRLVRKSMGGGRGRGSRRGGRGGAARGSGARSRRSRGADGIKLEDTNGTGETADIDEDEMDVDEGTAGNAGEAEQAELDEEDRELLGEVDAEESDEEEDDRELEAELDAEEEALALAEAEADAELEGDEDGEGDGEDDGLEDVIMAQS
ncbi:hypothetical protein K461DRAFT_289182 [Myriangium duriaei CBS 260.36]|uniref:Ino eighty subunit 1 n=1 Tax=Myriangium duriaei CBS 260.36 TaxID=1168546 RepID=A0A9P4MKY4_9PEZI|nr:hypothetical protein K461DRAFT_289182 [Myriangium duriaei CBS 260.36]